MMPRNKARTADDWAVIIFMLILLLIVVIGGIVYIG